MHAFLVTFVTLGAICFGAVLVVLFVRALPYLVAITAGIVGLMAFAHFIIGLPLSLVH